MLTHLQPAVSRVSRAASRPGHRLRLVFPTLLSLFFASSAQAQFSVQATTLVFNYGAGTNVLPAQYLDVSGPFSATASVMTPIGVNWLAVSPSTQFANTLTAEVTASAETLENGVYFGSIEVSPASGGPAIAVAVQLNVAAPVMGGTLLVTPGSLNLISDPTQQSVTIASADPAQPAVPFLFVVSPVSVAGSRWLSVVGPQGLVTTETLLTTPITLSVAASGESGSATGTISVGAVQIPVTYTAEVPVAFIASPSSLTFMEQAAGSPPQTQFVQLSATGGASMQFTVQAPSGVSVTPASGVTPATLSVSVAAAGTTGSSSAPANINLVGPTGIQTQIPLHVTVIPVSNLGFNPSSLSFAYQTGGSAPPQTIQVSVPGGGSAPFDASAFSQGNWLSVSPAEGTAPAILTVTAAPTVMSAGVYSGQIMVGSGASSVTIPVTLTVTTAPAFSAVPSIIQETLSSGSAPLQISLQVTPAGVTPTPFTAVASSAGNWLSVTPSSGSAPAQLSVTLTAANLAAGTTYQGSITITPATGAAITVPVLLIVNTAPQPITVSPASLTFAYTTGGVIPPPQTVQLSGNARPFSIVLLASSLPPAPSPWLSVGPLKGNIPAALSVSVSPAALGDGTYGLSILIDSTDPSSGFATQQLVPVTLTVTTVSTVSVSATSITTTLPSGSAAMQQSIEVTAPGGAAVPFTVVAASSTNWLSVSSSSGTTPAVLSVSIAPGTLTAAAYTGAITVSPSGGPAITIPVMLTTTYSSISFSPTPLTFSYQIGGNPPLSQSIQVTGNGASQGFTASIAGISIPGNWLSITPLSATTPASVLVTASPVGLAAGTYVATIALICNGGSSAGPILVTLTVTGAGIADPAVTTVVNAASFSGGGIAAGEIVTIGGTNLGPAIPFGLTLDANGAVARSLGGISVAFGGYAAPLIYVSPSQINCVVPYEISTVSSPAVQVTYGSAVSNSFPLSRAAAAPAIFTLNGSGTGLAAMITGSGGANGPLNPAPPGSTVVIYLTGEGQTNPGGVTGQVTAVNNSGSGPLTPQPLLPLAVTIGGETAIVPFYGEAPGLIAGVLQVNVEIPANLPAGAASLSVVLGGVVSQPGVTIFIGSN